MAVPKRRSSKMKKRLRKASKRWYAPLLSVCKECGSAKRPHTVCPTCGQYKGKQIIVIEN